MGDTWLLGSWSTWVLWTLMHWFGFNLTPDILLVNWECNCSENCFRCCRVWRKKKSILGIQKRLLTLSHELVQSIVWSIHNLKVRVECLFFKSAAISAVLHMQMISGIVHKRLIMISNIMYLSYVTTNILVQALCLGDILHSSLSYWFLLTITALTRFSSLNLSNVTQFSCALCSCRGRGLHIYVYLLSGRDSTADRK